MPLLNGCFKKGYKCQSVTVLGTHTQLVWEVKTDEGGLHDKDKKYKGGDKGA